MEDGGALFDSRVIVEYVDTLSPVARLIPQPGRDRAAVKCWEAIADGLLDACVTIVKEKQRPEAQRSQEWIDRQYGKIHASLDAMDKSLGENAHCMGINYSLADIAVGCALGYLDLRFAELDWRTGHIPTWHACTTSWRSANPSWIQYPRLNPPRSATRFPQGASLRTGGRNPPRSAARSPQGASLRTGKAGSARPHGHILLTFVFQTLNACPALNSMYADSANSEQANTFFSVATGRRCAMRAPSGAVSTLAQTSAISAGQ